ncbi:MAG: YraN family protein [Desulfovibrionaceae bacterium]
MVDPRKQLGNTGEDIAAHFLQQQGFCITARNWRAQQLELDIIARDGDTLVFVEVKTRTHGGMTSPVEAITPRKQQSCIRAARAYLAAHHVWQIPCRFDIVCVELLPSPSILSPSPNPVHGKRVLWNGVTFSVEHYSHAFELPSALDSGNTAWQPW